jgi:hypothetical protein
MDGDIRLTLEREPNSFLASTIAGEFEQVIVARDQHAHTMLGMGSRSVMPAFVNGRPQPLGYLSQLRVDRRHRGRTRLLTGGYAVLRDLHADGTTPFYVSTIVADNRPARRILEAGLKGFPTYRRLERLATLVLPVARRRRVPRSSLHVARASADLLPEIVACLERNLSRYQFAPHWTSEVLGSPTRTRGLAVSDFYVALRGGRVVGCLARWDQRHFKQAVVRGYSRRLRTVRPLANVVARLAGSPRLPPTGTVLRNAFITHVAIDGDDPHVLRLLLTTLYNDSPAQALDYLTLAFADRNPFTAVVRAAFRHRIYASMLYAVHWEDGRAALDRLDGRIPHVEVALL